MSFYRLTNFLNVVNLVFLFFIMRMKRWFFRTHIPSRTRASIFLIPNCVVIKYKTKNNSTELKKEQPSQINPVIVIQPCKLNFTTVLFSYRGIFHGNIFSSDNNTNHHMLSATIEHVQNCSTDSSHYRRYLTPNVTTPRNTQNNFFPSSQSTQSIISSSASRTTRSLLLKRAKLIPIAIT